MGELHMGPMLEHQSLPETRHHPVPPRGLIRHSPYARVFFCSSFSLSMREAPRYKPRGRCVCPSSPLPAVWRVCRGGGWGLTPPQAAILTTDLSDGEACVLSASGPGKVSVSFRSEKAVVAIKVPS